MTRVLCRLVSGNSIEEKLLKNGTKDLIREVAAQGNDYSMAFLTQVPMGRTPETGAQGGALLHGLPRPQAGASRGPLLCLANDSGAV